jgi:dihydropteroate synthase
MDKDTFFQKKRFIRIGGNYLDLSVPRVAGILNVTPDSFYDGGRFLEKKKMLAHVDKMMHEGVDFIDVGACSSRPGAPVTDVREEMKRLINTLGPIREKWPELNISVDTIRSEVARYVIENFKVNIINDISGGTADPDMIDLIAEFQIPYIIMHMKGTPETMQNDTTYSDLLLDIIGYFSRQTEQLKQKGVHDVIIDPGFGFGKSLEQNFQILYHLGVFKMFNLPIMVGLSRKSMIYRSLDLAPDLALNGTTALHVMALERGANILRVHDVCEARQVILLYKKSFDEGQKYTGRYRD